MTMLSSLRLLTLHGCNVIKFIGIEPDKAEDLANAEFRNPLLHVHGKTKW